MATEKKHALYLMPFKDGKYGPVELIAATDVRLAVFSRVTRCFAAARNPSSVVRAITRYLR